MKAYAICKICKQPMAPGTGCAAETVTCNGEVFSRIHAGAELDFDPDMVAGDTCHICNAAKGQYHHFNCDTECCPRCHRQLVGCDCEVAFEHDTLSLRELLCGRELWAGGK